MIRTAITMLVGDRTKFLGIVFGLAFASLLITQQASIFRGILVQTYGHVSDSPQADIWVGDPGMQEMDTTELVNERELQTVRAQPAVAWAVPLARRLLLARRPAGELLPVMVMGIDDATLIGAPLPGAMLEGAAEDLRAPYSMIVDQRSTESRLRVPLPDGGTRTLRVGDTMLIGGASITVAGICRSTSTLMLYPTLYMRRSQARSLDAAGGSGFNYILAGLVPGADGDEACRDISQATGLTARTRSALSDHVLHYYLTQTGLVPNFGIAVLLGFVVGAAIAGQTFSQFVYDNRRTFAALKAMGMRDQHLAGMLLVQALIAAGLGFGLGVGGAVAFGAALQGTDLGFRLEPALLILAAVAVLTLSLGAALFSLRSVLRVDPALVFRS